MNFFFIIILIFRKVKTFYKKIRKIRIKSEKYEIMIKIAEIRKEKGISQKELAKMLNISPGNLCEWEKGRIEPNLDALKKISEILETSLDYLVGNTDDFGNIIVSSQLTDQMSNDEKKLLRAYRSMPDIAKRKIIEDAEFYAYEYEKQK